jgi:hypothetical protein
LSQELPFDHGFTEGSSLTDTTSRIHKEPLSHQFKEVKTIGFAPNSCVSWDNLLRTSHATLSTPNSFPSSLKISTESKKAPWNSVPQDFDQYQQVLVVNCLGEVLSDPLIGRKHTRQNPDGFVQGSSKQAMGNELERNCCGGIHEEEKDTDQLYSSCPGSGYHRRQSTEQGDPNRRRRKRCREEDFTEDLVSKRSRRNPSRAVKEKWAERRAQELDDQSWEESLLELGG